MARAVEILACRYALIVTDVPFLVRGKQGDRLRKSAETHHGDAKVFVSRIFRWLADHGTLALLMLTPQHWLFLTISWKLRMRPSKSRPWNVVAPLRTEALTNPCENSI